MSYRDDVEAMSRWADSEQGDFEGRIRRQAQRSRAARWESIEEFLAAVPADDRERSRWVVKNGITPEELERIARIGHQLSRFAHWAS